MEGVDLGGSYEVVVIWLDVGKERDGIREDGMGGGEGDGEGLLQVFSPNQ